jgi:hypothetical protein
MPMEPLHGWAPFFRLLNACRMRRTRDSRNRSATDERFRVRLRHKEPNSWHVLHRIVRHSQRRYRNESVMEFFVYGCSKAQARPDDSDERVAGSVPLRVVTPTPAIAPVPNLLEISVDTAPVRADPFMDGLSGGTAWPY